MLGVEGAIAISRRCTRVAADEEMRLEADFEMRYHPLSMATVNYDAREGWLNASSLESLSDVPCLSKYVRIRQFLALIWYGRL